MKRIFLKEYPNELEIATMFSTEPLKSHPKNHCVPIIEVLPIPGKAHQRILVMPHLRTVNSPFFKTVGEVVAFLHQIFEVRFPLLMHWIMFS